MLIVTATSVCFGENAVSVSMLALALQTLINEVMSRSSSEQQRAESAAVYELHYI